jgi:nucleotide-binding universal stress UspA family protein
MADQRNCDVRRLVRVGSLGETVARYADDLGADLVTVTTGSNGWWKRLCGKSEAAAIANATDRPMCVAPLSATAPQTAFRCILCVVSLDGTDDPHVRFSEEVALRCDATLLLLHVLPEVSEAAMAYGLPGVDDRPLSREVAEQRLRQLTAGLSQPHLTVVSTGSADRSIASVAHEHNADVVITGRRDRSFSGLDVNSVLSQVSCPVISVPVYHRRVESSADRGRLCLMSK